MEQDDCQCPRDRVPAPDSGAHLLPHEILTELRPHAASLHWVDASGSPQFLALHCHEFVVGRHSTCNLILQDGTISREHAKLIYSAGAHLLVDLASIHGTFVNEKKILACLLRSGDRIRFGRAPQSFQYESNVSGGVDAGLSPEQVSEILRVEFRKSVDERWDLNREILLAEEVQQALLPKEIVETEGFRIRGHSTPTRYVGGDFYDFIAVQSGSLIGVLGDVSGKGVAASLLSSMILGSLQVLLRLGGSLEGAVGTLNTLLCERGSGRFATLFLFRLDSNGEGRFVSAGHNPAYIYRRRTGTVVEVPSSSAIVGAFASASFESGPIYLETGDVLLVYSDGLPDAQDARGEMLGEDEVMRAVQKYAPGGADHLKSSLLGLLLEFTKGQKQVDDVTFIVLERA